MRLIDANKLKEEIDKMFCECECECPSCEPSECAECVADRIINADTVDAELIKHGEWVNDVVCSKCGFYRQTTRSNNLTIGNYCPNCGAKMDGKESDNEQA